MHMVVNTNLDKSSLKWENNIKYTLADTLDKFKTSKNIDLKRVTFSGITASLVEGLPKKNWETFFETRSSFPA